MSENYGTDAAVLEFVTVAAEYCATIEQLSNYNEKGVVEKMQKILPLLYLKATLLPKISEEEEAYSQRYVTEEDWLTLFATLKEKLGDDVEYLEVFDDRMHESETPVVASLAENFVDIYQDLRDFLTNFHLGTEQVVAAALWQLQIHFPEHWGQYTVNALRAIHKIATKEKNDDNI